MSSAKNKIIVIPLYTTKTAFLHNLRWLTYIYPPYPLPQSGDRYGALYYSFIYRIFRRRAKGIVI